MVPTFAEALEPGAAIEPAQTIAQFSDSLGLDYNVQTNLVYTTANNVELKLDLYQPRRTTGPVPLVVYFHGGGWVEGKKETNVLYFLPYLQMGFAVANVGYRLGRVSPAPAAVEDGRCALRWLIRQATRLPAEFKIDTQKIILTGSSAGGHLALITGLLPAGNPFDRSCAIDDNMRWGGATEPALTVAAIINHLGITDVEDLLSGPNARHYAIEWFGAMQNCEALARSVSPLQYVRAGLPPIFTVHGDIDPVVPYTHATRLHDALKKANVPNELMTIAGGNHGAFTRAESQRIGAAIRAFLIRQGIKPVTN